MQKFKTWSDIFNFLSIGQDSGSRISEDRQLNYYFFMYANNNNTTY